MPWVFPAAAKARITYLEERVEELQGRITIKDRRILELEKALALYESPEAGDLRRRREELQRSRGSWQRP